MTPAEIRLIKEHVTQQNVDDLALYLDNWMKASKQPSKNCVKQAVLMTDDDVEPHAQVTQLLGSIYDWFAYGN